LVLNTTFEFIDHVQADFGVQGLTDICEAGLRIGPQLLVVLLKFSEQVFQPFQIVLVHVRRNDLRSAFGIHKLAQFTFQGGYSFLERTEIIAQVVFKAVLQGGNCGFEVFQGCFVSVSELGTLVIGVGHELALENSQVFTRDPGFHFLIKFMDLCLDMRSIYLLHPCLHHRLLSVLYIVESLPQRSYLGVKVLRIKPTTCFHCVHAASEIVYSVADTICVQF